MAQIRNKRLENVNKKRKRQSLLPVIAVLMLIIAIVIVLIVIAVSGRAKLPDVPGLTGETVIPLSKEEQPAPLEPVSEPSDTDIVPPAPVTEPPIPVTEKPEEPGTQKPAPTYVHDYPGALPQSAKVPDNWFSDALFVGDSRTVGLASYSGVTEATYYGKVSLNIQSAFKTKFLDEDKHTILEAIAADPKYRKVYFWFGLNEIGWPSTASFCSLYKDMIRQTRELLGDDVPIYVMAIIPVSEAYAEKNAKNGISNENVVKFNNALAAMCQELDGVSFLNIVPPFVNDVGALSSSRSSDGAHLNKASVLELFEYLKVHA